MAEDREIKTLEEDLKVQEYSQKLRALRENGVTKLNDARIELTSVKKNKLIDDSDRQKRIEELKKIIEEASVVAEKNKAEVNALSKEAVKYVNSVSREIEQKVNERQKRKMEGAKSFYQKEVEKIKAEGAKREEEIKATYANGDPQMLKSEIDICRYETKSALFDSKSRYLNEIDKAKAARHQAYVDHVQKNRELRNGKAAFGEDMKMKWKDFIRSFTPSAFFLANGLYIAIIIFFIVCIIAAPLRGSGNLLSPEYLHDSRTGIYENVLCSRCRRLDPPCGNRPLDRKNGCSRFCHDRTYPASWHEHRIPFRDAHVGFLSASDGIAGDNGTDAVHNPLCTVQFGRRFLYS